MVRRGSSVQIRSEALESFRFPGLFSGTLGGRVVCTGGRCVGGNAKVMPLTQVGEFYYIVLPISQSSRSGVPVATEMKIAMYSSSRKSCKNSRILSCHHNIGKDRTAWRRQKGNRLSSLLFSVPSVTGGIILPVRTRGTSRENWSSGSTASSTESIPCTGKPR